MIGIEKNGKILKTNEYTSPYKAKTCMKNNIFVVFNSSACVYPITNEMFSTNLIKFMCHCPNPK